MPIALGQKTELAMADESTFGTESAGTKNYFDAVSESVVIENPNIVSARLRGGRLPTASALIKGGRKRSTGNVEVEVQAQSIGWWLKHLMGAVATTGTAAPFTHTFTLGDLPVGFTMWIKRDIETFTYLGTRVNNAEFSVSDQMLRATFGVLGQDAALSGTFGTPSYPADNDIFAFHEATMTIDSTEEDVREVSVSIDNQLIEMPKLGSRLNRQPVQGRAVITGTIRKEFEDNTAYTKFVNGQSATFSLKFVGKTATGTNTDRDIEFKFNAIFYTGGTPTVGSPEPIPQELPFEVRDDGTANGGIEIILKNDTSTYA